MIKSIFLNKTPYDIMGNPKVYKTIHYIDYANNSLNELDTVKVYEYGTDVLIGRFIVLRTAVKKAKKLKSYETFFFMETSKKIALEVLKLRGVERNDFCTLVSLVEFNYYKSLS